MLMGVMESSEIENLHWQGTIDSYIVNMFWKYVDPRKPLKPDLFWLLCTMDM